MDPAIEISEFYQCQRAQHDEENHRQGGRIGRVLKGESDLVDIIEQ
jgi:hypothetical protein